MNNIYNHHTKSIILNSQLTKPNPNTKKDLTKPNPNFKLGITKTGSAKWNDKQNK